MRKLATVRKIELIVPHKNADRLEVAIIGGWPAVVAKGQYKTGDLVVFCEIDSLLPQYGPYDFLDPSCQHREPDGTVWYRIRSVRLRGQLSQGLVLPLSVLPLSVLSTAELQRGTLIALEDGFDVTEILGIRKYEKPVSPSLSGVAKGQFPGFIPKTDEERIQNLVTEDFYGLRFHRSEKLDGSSCTVYRRNGVVGVCSRNLELVENPDNGYWKAAWDSGALNAVQQNDLEIAIQGEVVGPGIQGNPYKLNKIQFFAFNVFDIAGQRYLPKDIFKAFCEVWNIPSVPILDERYCPEDIDSILADADGPSVLNPGTAREGVVWVCDRHERRFSFKAISNNFLLGGGE